MLYGRQNRDLLINPESSDHVKSTSIILKTSYNIAVSEIVPSLNIFNLGQTR